MKGSVSTTKAWAAPVSAQGITPMQEWGRDSRPLTFLDTGVVAEAFLHHETRLVDKGACISFQGRKYETKPSLIGCKVEISYDPMSPEVVRVSYPGITPFEAEPVKIGNSAPKLRRCRSPCRNRKRKLPGSFLRWRRNMQRADSR